MQLVVVGGVPGAGKSTVLRPYAARAGVRVLDPDTWRGRIRRRALLHLAHQAAVWAAILLGPALIGVLLVHDTATRPRRRRVLLWLARRRGWEVTLLLVDVTRSDALVGQLDRGRLAPAAAFDRHWLRWVRLREQAAAARSGALLVTRTTAADVVGELVHPTGAPRKVRHGTGPSIRTDTGPATCAAARS